MEAEKGWETNKKHRDQKGVGGQSGAGGQQEKQRPKQKGRLEKPEEDRKAWEAKIRLYRRCDQSYFALLFVPASS